MSDLPSRQRHTRVLSELVAGVLQPVGNRRAFAAADLAAAWREIAGPRYADCTCPDRIDWPRGDATAGAVLWVRADGPRAVLLQHELGQLIERVNGYLGYGAIARIRLVQGPVPRRPSRPAPAAPTPEAEARAAQSVAAVGDDALRAALARLGRSVFTERG